LIEELLRHSVPLRYSGSARRLRRRSWGAFIIGITTETPEPKLSRYRGAAGWLKESDRNCMDHTVCAAIMMLIPWSRDLLQRATSGWHRPPKGDI